jgi:hypothetical protein
MEATDETRDRDAIRAAIEARRFSAGMKAALQRVLKGESYRMAAEGEGVGWRELHRNAGTVSGLRDAHKRAWLEHWGAAFPATWRHHVRDLDEAG